VTAAGPHRKVGGQGAGQAVPRPWSRPHLAAYTGASGRGGSAGSAANIQNPLFCCGIRCAPALSGSVLQSRHSFRSHVRACLGRGGEGHWKGRPNPGFSKSKKDPPSENVHAVTPPATEKWASILSCGDVEAKPGPPPTSWVEEDYALVSDLVEEAFGRLGISPVRDAFATPANHRFAACWTKEDDAFAQPWD